jgi:hypothetical protein
MTEENAKEYLINISYKLGTMGIEYLTEKDGEKMRDAIHALEQEPILDKIRAEIEQVKSIMNEEIINHDRKDLINFVNGLNQSLVIIDKYKAESDGKE